MKRSLFIIILAIACAATPAIAAEDMTDFGPATPLPQVDVQQNADADHWSFPYGRTREVTDHIRKFQRPTNLIRFGFYLEPRERTSFSYEGLRFSLEDDEHIVPLPHHLGIGDLPMNPALDEARARFHINRPEGSVILRRRISIALKPDGLYTRDYLHAACGQAVDLLRSATFVHKAMLAWKQCAGASVVPLQPGSTITMTDSQGRETRFTNDTAGRAARREVRWDSDIQTVRVEPASSAYILGILLR
ncbi:hypothetical protein ACNI65_17855 [Roseateles sp. So40a]|uniref:hypothetical protein n=1 Tax=Roseateles sp. So40a TaxID=3400226 RepID=UPI003A867B9B